MNRSQVTFEFYPKDCLHCPLRRVIHVEDRHYQLCCLDYKNGWGAESFFKDEDLKNGWKTEKCPLIEIKE